MSIEIVTTSDFDNDVKQLRRRFRRINQDIKALIDEMEHAGYRGLRMSGLGRELFKVRLSNRSSRRGKSGGFRAIYATDKAGRFVFVHIYSKTDQNDVGASEIFERIRHIE